MTKITETRVTKRGQRGVVHCDGCAVAHKDDARIEELRRAVALYECVLCRACCQARLPTIGRTEVKVYLWDHGLAGWSGVREATAEDCESIYRAMRIRDIGLAQLSAPE